MVDEELERPLYEKHDFSRHIINHPFSSYLSTSVYQPPAWPHRRVSRRDQAENFSKGGPLHIACIACLIRTVGRCSLPKGWKDLPFVRYSLPPTPAERALSQHVVASYCSNTLTQNVHDFWRQLGSPGNSYYQTTPQTMQKSQLCSYLLDQASKPFPPSPNLRIRTPATPWQHRGTEHSVCCYGTQALPFPFYRRGTRGTERNSVAGPHSWGVVGQGNQARPLPLLSPLPMPLEYRPVGQKSIPESREAVHQDLLPNTM